jgi:hypothetical protein
MEDFSLSACEWARVRDAARAVLSAALAGDAGLRASSFEALRLVLAGLRSAYGDHPVLLGTGADFCDDTLERERLYREAVQGAGRAGLPAYAVRLAVARVLLDEFGEPGRAFGELVACEPELAARGDDSERAEWADLLARCGRPGDPGRPGYGGDNLC